MSEDERRFEERLENWGRWLRDPRRPEVSYLYSPPEEEAPAEAKESAEIDLRDALPVQRAWTQLPTCDEKHRKAKLVLAMVYAYPWRSSGNSGISHDKQVKIGVNDTLIIYTTDIVEANRQTYYRSYQNGIAVVL